MAMRGHLKLAAAIAALSAQPALADDNNIVEDRSEAEAVIEGVDAFFAALRSDDKSLLPETMVPEATIFILRDNHQAGRHYQFMPVSEYLERRANSSARVDELMTYKSIQIEDRMATVTGPYIFAVEGVVSHCGVNAMTMIKIENRWRVGNTTFTMVPPEECESVGAPRFPEVGE